MFGFKELWGELFGFLRRLCGPDADRHHVCWTFGLSRYVDDLPSDNPFYIHYVRALSALKKIMAAPSPLGLVK